MTWIKSVLGAAFGVVVCYAAGLYFCGVDIVWLEDGFIELALNLERGREGIFADGRGFLIRVSGDWVGFLRVQDGELDAPALTWVSIALTIGSMINLIEAILTGRNDA